MNHLQRWMGVVLASLGVFFAGSLSGDTIELTNGDVLNGHVVSLDGKELVLKSELLGELKLDREKVSAIHLGDKPVLTREAAPAPSSQGKKADPAVNPEVQKVLDSVPSSDDVLKQLQGGSVDKEMIGALQQKFPLLNTPEASGYFNETVSGLMTGRLNIQDVRKDAVNARDQLKDLQDELGPEGAALNGYMSILNNFIRETEPPPSRKKPAADKPAKTKTEDKKKTPATFPPKP